MKIDDLESKLIAAARADLSDERVPYAFEKRVMAQLRSVTRSGSDPLAFWVAGLWRAAVPCVAITLLMGLVTWSAARSQSNGSASADSLTVALENTMLAPLDSPGEVW